jgi:putative MATE family efflux protein
MVTTKKSTLDDDKIGPLLLKLSLPSLFGMLVMTLYNVIDTIFVGHLVGSLAIAGLSIVFPIQMFSMGIGQMMGMGGASSISRYIGAGKNQKAELILGNAMTGAAFLSVLLAVLGLIAPDFWLRLLGASDAILPYARDYFVIILYGIIFQTMAMSLNNMLISEGNSRVAMVGMIIGAVINIILAAVFMMGLGMGIKGSALATVIAQVISYGYLFRFYYSGKSYLRFHTRNLIPNFQALKSILKIGIASFARSLGGSLSAIFVNHAIVMFGGDLAMSTFGIINRIMMLAFMPGMVIGQGLQPILGYNYGAKRYDRGLRVIKIAIIAATICSVLVFILLMSIPDVLIKIFTNDADLIASGIHASRRVFLALPILGFLLLCSLVFQALGKAVKSFITALARPVLCMLPLIYILPQFLQLDGVWLAFPCADIIVLGITMIMFIPEIKRLQQLNRESKLKAVKEQTAGQVVI